MYGSTALSSGGVTTWIGEGKLVKLGLNSFESHTTSCSWMASLPVPPSAFETFWMAWNPLFGDGHAHRMKFFVTSLLRR